MKTVALILVLVAVAWVVIQLVRDNNGHGGWVTLADFPALVSALKASPSADAFWVVLVPGTARSDGCPANLQYSVEDGVAGIEWVLLADRNLEDRQLFETAITRAGGVVEERFRNEVPWLRAVELQDSIKVGQAFLQAAYNVTPETKLELINSGFRWPLQKT